MKRVVWMLACLVGFDVTLVFGAQGLQPTRQELVVVTRPMIVGFFPPVTDRELQSDDGTIEGLAHLRYAIEDAVKCISESGKTVHASIVLSRTLVIEQDSKRERFRLPGKWPDSVGAYLLAPGKQAQAVYARDFPGAFAESLIPAAGKYFSAPKCQTK